MEKELIREMSENRIQNSSKHDFPAYLAVVLIYRLKRSKLINIFYVSSNDQKIIIII